jgi:kynurenine formamidase
MMITSYESMCSPSALLHAGSTRDAASDVSDDCREGEGAHRPDRMKQLPGVRVRCCREVQRQTDHVHVSAEEFGALFRSLSTWGRWGDDDERGALNHLTPERVAAAATRVRDGITVALSWPLNTSPAADNPHPADHHMTELGSGPLSVAKDYVGVDFHNDTHTHIDALSHVGYEGSLYNGKPATAVTSRGAAAQSIEVLENGLVGRGVLLDIARLRGAPWLEPGENVFRDELEAAERGQRVTVREGDILLVRTGHARRLEELGPWETATAKAGLHPTAMTFLADRGVAALGSDTNADTAPSSTEGVSFPIHVLALNAMGVHLLDYLQLEDLSAACEHAARWEFLFIAAPLRIPGGTGSPLNPLAIL